MKNRGQITVYLCLVINVMLLLGLTSLEGIRIYMGRGKVERSAIGAANSIMADYNSELEELHGILQAWDKPLKIEIVIGGNIGPFTKLMEMLENVRTTNNNLLFVVIMYMA